MRVETFISRRYLFAGGKKALLSAITFVAVAGVAVGVAALIIVIGVMDGAKEDLFAKMIEVYPHVKITGLQGGELRDPEPVLRELRKHPEIASVEPVVSKESLFTAQLGAQAELVAGRLVGMEDFRRDPLVRLIGPTEGLEGQLADFQVLLGKPLAEKLRIKPGASVRAITGVIARSANRQNSGGRDLKVVGIFETGYYAYDSLTALISPATAEKIFGLAGSVDYVQAKLREPMAATDFKLDLRPELGPGVEIVTWIEEQGPFFQSLLIQKWGLFLILMLIVLVAGFNVIGTLILMVIDKTREIGILKAYGSSQRMIRSIFLNSGVVIGAMGTAVGLALGLFGCFLLKYVIRLEMPPSVYNFEHLPVAVKPLTVAVIVASSMGVCMVAAIFPAIQAARLNPVEALRHD